jgi:hypothetical protein
MWLLSAALAGDVEAADAAPMDPISTIEGAQPLPEPTLWQHPNPSAKRMALRRMGGLSMAAGGIWFLSLGDTLGAGDPSSLMAGFGLVAVGGSLMGGMAASSRPDGQPMDMRATAPTLGLTLSPGGTTIMDEVIPYGGGLSLSPRFAFGERTTLVGGFRVHGQLGSATHVDVRPQYNYDTVYSHRRRGVDLEPELRWGFEHADIRLKQMVWMRWEKQQYADGEEFTVRRDALTPALGVRWYVSERQAFAVHAGPRWNRLVYEGETSTQLGPVYGDASYAIHLEHPQWWGFDRVSRLRITYIHSNFDGLGMDLGASVGFFGPMTVEWDFRLKRPEAKHAVQAGFAFGLNSPEPTVGLTVGWAPEWSR